LNYQIQGTEIAASPICSIFFTVRLQKAFSYKVLKLLLYLKLLLLSYQKLIEYSRIQNIDYIGEKALGEST